MSSASLALKDYYSQDYHHIPASEDELAKHTSCEEFKIKIVQDFLTKGKLLDIGPSAGGFLYLAKKAGFEVEALEMDSRCCQFLREKLRIPAFESSDIPRSLAGKSYDAVTLWQVIEHLPDPWNCLKAIVNSLKEGGFLVLAAPNPAAFQFKIFRHRWTHLDAPRHIMLFPIELLHSFLKPLGMHPVLSVTNDEGSLDWNRFGWQYSLGNIFSSTPPSQRVRRPIRMLGKAISKLLSPVEKINGLGSCYTLVFKKGGKS